MKKTLLSILMVLTSIITMAQSADPIVTFNTKNEDGEMEEVELKAGEERSAEAPLEITCKANVECPSNMTYKLEWQLYDERQGEDSPLLTRFDDEMKYTLMKDGSFGIKLYITFTDKNGDTVEYEAEPIKITIAASKLNCPDGFSPNGDGINDKLVIKCQSIVKCSGLIFNRWGQKLHTFTVENLADGWDGMVGGSPVKDGVYFIQIDAYGSDGIHYKIKKAINVLKGYREDSERDM